MTEYDKSRGTGFKRIKKILLLNPPAIVKESWADAISSFPLGLAYIAAVLERDNFEVEIIDCYIEGFSTSSPIQDGLMRVGLSDDEIARAVERSNPDLIGISVQFSCQLNAALHISSLVRKILPYVITVAGGSHVSAAPASIARGSFDWIILGEGEQRLLHLVRTINASGTPVNEHGIMRPADALSVGAENIKFDTIEDLDSLPMPSYHLLPLKKYWQTRNNRRWVNMIATRGCPYTCTFCSIHMVMGRKIRCRSVEAVLQEVAALKREFAVEQIFFEDDNLTFDMAWARDFFTGIIRLNLNIEIYLRNGIRADKVDLDLLKLMRAAGVQRVWFAPESGSQKTLDRIINKKMRLSDCETAIRMAKQAGLAVTCFLVIGFPDETLEDVQQTIRYGHKLRKLGCDSIWISCAVPYPGTALFRDCLARGILSEGQIDYQSLSTMESIISNEWFTAEEIKTMRDQAMIALNRPDTIFGSEALHAVMLLLKSDPLLFGRKVLGRLKRILRQPAA